MGMSASGIIFFGVDLGEDSPLYIAEDDEDRESPEELDELILEKEGVEDPYRTGIYPALPDEFKNYSREGYQRQQAYIKENHPEWIERRDTYLEMKKQLKMPVDIVRYGHHDANLYGLELVGTNISSGGWDITKFKLPEVSDQAIKEAAAFCEKWGLPAFSEPMWLLTSSYG